MFARAALRFGQRAGFRSFSAQARSSALRWGTSASLAGAVLALSVSQVHASSKIDYDDVRKTIANILDAPEYDDGSFGPVLVRLAWHSSGTYDCASGTGGSFGGTMRFAPESNYGANAGLKVARDIMDKVKAKYPDISYGDLWTLAGVVAIEEMGGPKIKWKPGRVDAPDNKSCPPDGRLPDGALGAQHLRDIFYRMGFNDQEIVALTGAHSLGRCHADRSGFSGPWTRAPTTFSNLFFQELLNNKWTIKKWDGPRQYQDPTGDLMMLPADMALIEDPKFRVYVEKYASDSAAFEKDFASAFSRLLALGVDKHCECTDKAALLGVSAGILGVAASARFQN